MTILLPTTTITAAVTGTLGRALEIRRAAKALLLEAAFVYGSADTTLKLWAQTRVLGGTWRDIANFAFATTTATKWSAVYVYTALAAATAVSDAALGDDTILNGFIGDEIRVKYTSTGTYAGDTTITLRATVKE